MFSSHHLRLRNWLTIPFISSGLMMGCGSDFDPASKITKLRILNVQARPSWLPLPLEDEEDFAVTELSVLTVSNENIGTLTYRWRWCPLLGPNSLAFECLITPKNITDILDVPPDTIPEDIFELGSTASITFPNQSIPRIAIEALCDQLRSQGEISNQVTLPECNGTFPISIRVDISDGEQTITSFKDVYLIYDEELFGEENLNIDPSLAGWQIGFLRNGEPITDNRFVLDETLDFKLKPQTTSTSTSDSLDNFSQFYDDICEEPASNGEVITREVTTRESVIVSWFITHGELSNDRTGYIPGPICDPGILDTNATEVLEEWELAKTNSWDAPKFIEELADTSTVTVYAVIRDTRGGSTYTSTTVRLREASDDTQ